MQKKEPLVSVLMCVYNGQKYLKQTIESVLHQTFFDFEFIIIDDASTDSTGTILAHYQTVDSRIQIHTLPVNKGLTYCLNLGLEYCKGKYIARIDADDMMYPFRLEKQITFLQRNEMVGLVGSSVDLMDEAGCLIATNIVPELHKKIKKCLKRRNPFFHSAVMARKDMMLRAGGYDPHIKAGQDYDLWIRMAQNSKLANLKEILTRYRILDTSISRSSNKKQSMYVIKVIYKNIRSGCLPIHSLIFLWKPILLIVTPAYLLRMRFTYRKKRDKKRGVYYLQ